MRSSAGTSRTNHLERGPDLAREQVPAASAAVGEAKNRLEVQLRPAGPERNVTEQRQNFALLIDADRPVLPGDSVEPADAVRRRP